MERIIAYLLGNAAKLGYLDRLKEGRYGVRDIFRDGRVLGIFSLNKRATEDHAFGHIVGEYVYI